MSSDVEFQSEIRPGKRRASDPASLFEGVRKIRYKTHPQTGRNRTLEGLCLRALKGDEREGIVHANLVICGNEKWMWIRQGKRCRRR